MSSEKNLEKTTSEKLKILLGTFNTIANKKIEINSLVNRKRIKEKTINQ